MAIWYWNTAMHNLLCKLDYCHDFTVSKYIYKSKLLLHGKVQWKTVSLTKFWLSQGLILEKCPNPLDASDGGLALGITHGIWDSSIKVSFRFHPLLAVSPWVSFMYISLNLPVCKMDVMLFFIL